MTVTTALLTLPMLVGAAARAQPLNCFPPPIDTCGKGVVRGTTDRVEWVAWWIESNFEWRRVHWYRLLDEPASMPAPGARAAEGHDGPVSATRPADQALRSCDVSPHQEALAACRALTLASDRTVPPAILYNVDRAVGKDGTRPGYRRSGTGGLVVDGQRHRAGTWCECWRGAVKMGKTQYCLVTQTASYAACRRVQ
jgi:hypothetical protein